MVKERKNLATQGIQDTRKAEVSAVGDFIYVCGHALWVCPWDPEEGIGSLWSCSYRSCEPLSAGNHTRVFYKNSAFSSLLSSLSPQHRRQRIQNQFTGQDCP